MKQKRILFTLAFLLIIMGKGFGQEEQTGYNPFVPANLDDATKLAEIPVVESSYHIYNISGDASYSEPSTFVWYVENGTMGTYDAINDVWIPATGTTAVGNGEVLELTGSATNASEIWVRWNDGTGNATGYIAVYERSSNNCIFDQQITGYKHQILVPPEVWLLVDAREECSDQTYAVTAQFNETHPNSFPYSLTYSYPGNDGNIVQNDTLIYEADLDASGQLTWDLTGVQDLDNQNDEVYVISIDRFTDAFMSEGKIAPLGAGAGQYPSIAITVLHLPQTGTMNMN